MTAPVHTTSLFSPLMLRTDLSREAATTYWSSGHATKVRKLPGVMEYLQRHFSESDHGFWPGTPTVGTAIPAQWRVDGCAELRMAGLAGVARAALNSREVMNDEQNVFARVIGKSTGPGGGRWWTEGHDDTVGQHITLLLRRRSGVKGAQFSDFVRDRLPSALLAGGARDVRAYTFLPVTRLVNNSPGVDHADPPQYRYHGGVVFGMNSREAVDELLATAAVRHVVDHQHTAVTAVHAYAVQRTVVVVRMR